ncbi:hypothetical protein CBR_g45852, partial [Chara braunii]
MATTGQKVKYILSQRAYVKLVLHAFKYQSLAVNGVLIGRLRNAGDGGESADPKGNREVVVEDAVPLFHGQLALLPMLELALMQIESYASTENLSIVGYYHGNERYDDVDFGNVGSRIAAKIADYFPDACALL